MTRLVNLQSSFQGHVISGNADGVDAFIGDETATAEARLGVYYDAYRLRLMECLTVDYPGLRALMSVAAFESLCLRYIDRHPSHHPNVRWFGRHLADFLAADGTLTRQPYLAEMARFEWARGLAFDAGNADVMAPDDLASMPAEDWPSLHLSFHPSLQRSRFAWNVGPLWRAVSAEEPIPSPQILDRPAHWAVWRQGITVYWRSLDDAEAGALDAFRDGRDFSEVCDALCEWIDAASVPEQMARMLRRWVAEGLVTS